MKLNGDYIQDMAELEQLGGYSWGENLLHVTESNGDEYLVNNVTGKARKIVEDIHFACFSDDEIDFATLDKLPNSHRAHSRRIDYMHMGRWSNCKNGLIALCWMLYPDGRYFGDSDGYGMEDNDELTVYCIMDENLNVIRPFTVVDDVQALLDELAQTK